MPEENRAILGCYTPRKYKGISILKVPVISNELTHNGFNILSILSTTR